MQRQSTLPASEIIRRHPHKLIGDTHKVCELEHRALQLGDAEHGLEVGIEDVKELAAIVVSRQLVGEGDRCVPRRQSPM